MRVLKSWFSIVVLIVALPLRGDAQQAAEPLRAGYAGNAECLDCHKKEVKHFTETMHAKVFQRPRTEIEKLGCESCHGPGKTHAESGGEERGGLITFGRKKASKVEVQNAACMQCHDKTSRMLWAGSTHESRNVACSSCHNTMETRSTTGHLRFATVRETCGSCHTKQKNAALKPSHMPLGENKLECNSCHNPHGSANPKMLIATSTNDACYSCHAEKRGPFLFEHPPVAENCANCHDPHGSSHEKMLKVSRPRLCQQCHQPTGHPQSPRTVVTQNGKTTVPTSDVQFVLNRECSNCHFNIHGSNHPAGDRWVR
jgi:DmsE family decaheme c-type cytochrome